MAELFGTTRNNITMHLKDIFSKELNENSVCKDFLHTAEDGKKYNTKYYNLDVIIAIGFKVNSRRAIDFRLWAINILKQYSVKGYVLDKERLKNGTFLDENYFDELLITLDKTYHENFTSLKVKDNYIVCNNKKDILEYIKEYQKNKLS